MFRPTWLNNLAIGTKLASRQFLEELIELKKILALAVTFIPSVPLHVAWVRFHTEVPGSEELDTDEHRGDHEVIHVQNWLNHHDLRDHDVKEEDDEEDRRAIVPLDWHQGQATERTAVVPGRTQGTLEAFSQLAILDPIHQIGGALPLTVSCASFGAFEKQVLARAQISRLDRRVQRGVTIVVCVVEVSTQA